MFIKIQEILIRNLQNSISVTECSNNKFGSKICGCKVTSSAECLRMLRGLRRQHNRLRIKRQKFLQAVEVFYKLHQVNSKERHLFLVLEAIHNVSKYCRIKSKLHYCLKQREIDE